MLLGNAIGSQKGNDRSGIVNISNPVVWNRIDFCCVVVLNGGSAVFDFFHLKICFCVAETAVRADCLTDVVIVPERKLQPCSAVRTVDNIADQTVIGWDFSVQQGNAEINMFVFRNKLAADQIICIGNDDCFFRNVAVQEVEDKFHVCIPLHGISLQVGAYQIIRLYVWQDSLGTAFIHFKQ